MLMRQYYAALRSNPLDFASADCSSMAQYAERSRNLRWLLAPDQVAGRGHVILLARSEHEADRQAQCIDYGVDFGAEPASGTAKSLGLNAPLFTRAPAA